MCLYEEEEEEKIKLKNNILSLNIYMRAHFILR